MQYFEDFAPGQVYRLGSYEMTEEEILAFAGKYDPQPFHTDPERAKDSIFGGLIASGWHTASVYMRLYVDALLDDAASLGSPGVEELRWLKPVRPGDVLSAEFHVLDVAPSSRHPNRGTVRFEARLQNQDGEVVCTMRGRGLFGRRPAEAG